MAEALKESYGIDVARAIAKELVRVEPRFPSRRFVAACAEGYQELELMGRAQHIAGALRRFLPRDFEEAAALLVASLGPTLDERAAPGMQAFHYLPHVLFVGSYGLDSFEASMAAQHALTQRFTAEFSIRAFLERHPERTLKRLESWSEDESAHVRRLVSEGTRPRLPWAKRLRAFQEDPRPVLALLERLRDDPELYVRRSVANNLNDIGKDHPDLLVKTARRWWKGASTERRWLVKHALRSAIKRADPKALSILGYGGAPRFAVRQSHFVPARARIGTAVVVSAVIENAADEAARWMIDLRVHYRKANGTSSPKVFKLKEIRVPAGGEISLSKRLSLAQMTTRTHYPGTHEVELIVNGESRRLGSFELRSEMPRRPA